MSQTTCRVCGQVYPDSQKSCPRCGCQQGAAIPAYLRCKHCGTVLPSSLRNCPNCGQGISPRTAGVVLFRELTGGQNGQAEGGIPNGAGNRQGAARNTRPKGNAAESKKSKRATRPSSRGRRALLWTGSVAAAALLLTGEAFLVKGIYANSTYRECLDLWNCGGSVTANKRTPDPVYEGTIEETPVDSLINIDVRRAAQTDSIDRIETIEESTPDSLFF